MNVRRVPAGEPPAIDLIEAMIADLVPLYGRIDTPDAPSADLVSYLVLEDGAGRAVAGGGVKRLGEDVAEIKRMYVVPEARGRGLGRALLGALEDEAQRLGYARVRLDTGPRQPGAQALYASAGYVAIPDYNGNPFASFWGEKRL